MVRRSYTRARIYIMVMHKETIQLHGILATLKSKPTAKRSEKELYLSNDGEDYCYFIINNHSPRAKCYR